MQFFFSGPSADDQRILISWKLLTWALGQQSWRSVDVLLEKPVGIVFLIAGYMSGCAPGYGESPGMSGALGGRGPGMRVD